MLIIRCAFKNLLGAGLRTWLNCLTLGIAMVVIVFLQGLYQSFEDTMKRARVAEEVGQGQYWQDTYDALDPLTFDDSHAILPRDLHEWIEAGRATPILVRPATIYPQGRMQNVTLKGIPPNQKILALPTAKLAADDGGDRLIIGQRMAEQLGMKEGETLTVRFKTARGAIDARDFLIAAVFHADVPAVDLGQIWIGLPTLAALVDLPHEASIVVLGNAVTPGNISGFKYISADELMKDTSALIEQKKKQAKVIYLLLLFVAMISIFDTQILAIFRRRKEIGLLLALGLTQNFVVAMFTIEGILHGFLASILGAVAGLPILFFIEKNGIPLPHVAEKMGIAGNIIYPTFSWQLMVGTFVIIMLILSVVSYLPARTISSLQPTQALRGS